MGSLQVYGTEGNLLLGAGHSASIITTRKHLLPSVDEDGWFHIPVRGDWRKAKWPQPVPGAFNYYHESSREFISSILDDREPVPGLEWGLHITEMMVGAVESNRTGGKYEMRTTLDY